MLFVSFAFLAPPVVIEKQQACCFDAGCVCLFQMSEDLAKQLASYKAQLQQVEAALSGNAENEDLLKLKKDLQVRAGGRG